MKDLPSIEIQQTIRESTDLAIRCGQNQNRRGFM